MSAREVELSGGAPWGFRMHGGVDQNQPLRISRVNPGRKASLCGVREGDVISSINGHATRGMSNADAHAMLRGAGPVLRLGLNEDREMSPRRRSIGKGSELKRPSQLITSTQEATPQEPVYATIKPPLTHNFPPSSPLRSSLNSLPSALNSSPHKPSAPVEPALKFHPTNPFYTTLPSNYTSASKLPISNGKSSISTLDRNKSSKPKDAYDHSSDLKSPSYFTTNFGSSSQINSTNNFAEKTNGYGFNTTNSTANDKSDISYDKVNQDNPSLPRDTELKNPFRSSRINSDPFEKYLKPEHQFNGKFENDTKNMTNSMSDNSFHKTREITERSTITEHKISEIVEEKTIKKIVLNGSGEDHKTNGTSYTSVNGERKGTGLPVPQSSKEYYQSTTQQSTRNEHFPTTPTQDRNDYLRANNQSEHNSASPSTKYHFVQLNNDAAGADTPSEPLTAKPPATPAPAHPASPTTKQNVDTDTQSCSVVVDENKQAEDVKTEISLPLINDTSIEDTQEKLKTSGSREAVESDLNSNSTELLDLNAIAKPDGQQSMDSISSDVQYVVESPEQSIKTKPKLNSNIKSKSLDNEEATKIFEITEDSSVISDDESTLNLITSNSVLVSDVESDIEWEKTDDLQDDSMGSHDLIEPLTTCDIPITITQSEQSRTLTPEEEASLRNCLQKLPLTNSTKDSSEIVVHTVQVVNHGVKHRLRKKASADDFIFQRLGPPRTLDVIDEEGSGDSSKSSRRQSYLSEKKNDYKDLDDDVFEDPKKIDKFVTKMNQNKFGKQIQQQCMLLDTKLKEPEVSEARGDWSVTNVEKMIGAEVVYLTDTSSSTSSIYDNSEDGDEEVDTDVSVRMITPTIEVTDTETLLKESFVPNKDEPIPENSRVHPIEILNENGSQPIPSTHEIVVLSTDDIKTDLTVKDLESPLEIICENNNNNEPKGQMSNNGFDLKMKVLKCELNDAINNLIKEVSSDSESSEKNGKEILNRQDSSSSVGSSQCTAKYNPTYSSLNDVANIVHDDMSETPMDSKLNTEFSNTSHVNDVFECVTGITVQNKNGTLNEPSSLKDLCVQKVAKFPYGDKILEELASVSKRLQNITIYGQHSSHEKSTEVISEKITQPKENMPYYPLPDVSSIQKVSLPSKDKEHPPPVKPRNSSLKLSQDENHWVGMPTETEPVYVCLSPSQKMLMEKTNTVITKEDASQLVDMHKKYVDRRGYNEYYDKDHKKENQRPHNPPVVPFKSQTGSRLLALIRDPAVTDNINSIKSRNQLKILDQIESIDKKSQAMSLKKVGYFSSAKDFSSNFKPIPPPRTRKFSSSIYESDESSDFTDSSFRSIKSERKSFHYSTGNLSKEIENDISSIQNMHRYYTDIRDQFKDQASPRRPSLPKDLCDQQMEYIRKKEKEVEAEIRRLENEKLNFPLSQKQGPKAPLISEFKVLNEQVTRTSSQSMLLKSDSEIKLSALKSLKMTEKPEVDQAKPDKGKLSVFSSSQEELLRDKMYSEYVNQMAEREERRQQKVIKITNNNKPKVTIASNDSFSKSMPALDLLDSKVNNRIEKEFIWRARERWNKLGIKDPETEDERDDNNKDVYKEPKVVEHKIKVIEGGEEKDVKKLPSHLQEFVRFTVKDGEQGKSSPGESSTGPTSPHVMILCAVIILVLAVGKMFLRMFRNK